MADDIIRNTKKRGALGLICITLAIVAACLIVWQTFTIVLLGFAGILFSVLLSSIASYLASKTNWPYRIVLVSVALLALLALALLILIATPLVSNQLSELIVSLPAAYSKFTEAVSHYTNEKFLSEGSLSYNLIFKNEKFFNQATEVFSLTLEAITGFLVFLFLGLYLSYDPNRYINGFLQLIPAKKRAKFSHVLSEIARALRWWLVGKGISMLSIGILTFIGLLILKVPLAFILSLVAALLAFIPYIGSIIASIPAILIGLSQSPTKALYVTILYLFVHLIEGYFITPIVEQETVSIPPALTVFVQIMLTLLVGFIGLALTSPLIVVVFVLVREFYLKPRPKRIPTKA